MHRAAAGFSRDPRLHETIMLDMRRNTSEVW
jgi:hypothetical protein